MAAPWLVLRVRGGGWWVVRGERREARGDGRWAMGDGREGSEGDVTGRRVVERGGVVESSGGMVGWCGVRGGEAAGQRACRVW